MALLTTAMRKTGIAVAVGLALLSASPWGCAQREPAQTSNGATAAAANTMVATIKTLSCGSFASIVARVVPSGTGASPAPAASSNLAGRLLGHATNAATNAALNTVRSNPQARAEFVNIVAGPLVNKMIDCNIFPSLP
ncbi:MAG: hypothetical protein WA814_12635 [Candidatus Baltobacteraceae bacterium]